MTRTILTVGALSAVYALALASADPWDFALGALLGSAVTWCFRRFLFVAAPIPAREMVRRSAHLPMLIIATFGNIVRGTWAVIRLSLGPVPPVNVGFVTIPDGGRTETGFTVSGLLDTLSPGSVLIDQDALAQTWTIHAIDASDQEERVRELDDFYERYQRPVWP